METSAERRALRADTKIQVMMIHCNDDRDRELQLVSKDLEEKPVVLTIM